MPYCNKSCNLRDYPLRLVYHGVKYEVAYVAYLPRVKFNLEINLFDK